MGSAPSSIKNDKLGSFFINKKIKSQVPIYLIRKKFSYGDNKFCFYLSTVLNKKHNSDLVIKLKPGITFVIDDIISYCNNEGGVYSYDAWVSFLNKIKKDDIEEVYDATN